MGLLGSTTVGDCSLGLQNGLEEVDTVKFDLDMWGLLILKFDMRGLLILMFDMWGLLFLTELQIVVQVSHNLLSVMRSLACAS